MRIWPMVMSSVSARLTVHVKTRVCGSVAARAGAARRGAHEEQDAVRIARLYFPENPPVRLVTFVLCMVLAGDARAQSLPSEPISVGNGRVVFGGEFFGTFGSETPASSITATTNTTRCATSGLPSRRRSAPRATSRRSPRSVSSTAMSSPRYAMFLRIRPWPERRFDVQVGRVPPAFGLSPKRATATTTSLSGGRSPISYLLSLRRTAVPATTMTCCACAAAAGCPNSRVGEPARDARTAARERRT